MPGLECRGTDFVTRLSTSNERRTMPRLAHKSRPATLGMRLPYPTIAVGPKAAHTLLKLNGQYSQVVRVARSQK